MILDNREEDMKEPWEVKDIFKPLYHNINNNNEDLSYDTSDTLLLQITKY